MFNHQTREQRAEKYKQALLAKGLKVSDNMMTVRQYLVGLYQQGKVDQSFLALSKITTLSLMAKRLCEADNWHYVKCANMKYTHRKSVTAYPVEVLNQLFAMELDGSTVATVTLTDTPATLSPPASV